MVLREKMTQILFETFNSPAFYVSIDAPLAIYATARTTGMVISSGDGTTHIVPIYEGFPIPCKIQRYPIGGAALTENLMHMLRERGYDFTIKEHGEMVRDIKEKLCYAALDFEEEIQLSAELASRPHVPQVPDGRLSMETGSRGLARCSTCSTVATCMTKGPGHASLYGLFPEGLLSPCLLFQKLPLHQRSSLVLDL